MGWKNQSFKPIEASFSFTEQRRFSAVRLYAHEPSPAHDLGSVTQVLLRCAPAPGEGNEFVFRDVQETGVVELRPEGAPCVGRELSLRLFFRGKWLALSEVAFDSGEQKQFDACRNRI